MSLKKYINSIFILLIFGCSPNENYEIESLWYARERNQKLRQFSNCDECDTQSTNCCIYSYNNKFYDRGESYLLDKNGNIDSIYSYRVPLGVTIMSVEDQILLTTFDTVYKEKLRNRKIYWNDKLNSIIDGDSIYNNFIIDKNNKYLLVETEFNIKFYRFK